MNSVDSTMKSVNTTGLMLSMLAIGGLLGGAFLAPQAFAQNTNYRDESNRNDSTFVGC